MDVVLFILLLANIGDCSYFILLNGESITKYRIDHFKHYTFEHLSTDSITTHITLPAYLYVQENAPYYHVSGMVVS